MKVAVVVPTYNEKNNIVQLIKEIKDYSYGSENEINLVIVDDNSSDGTASAIRALASREDYIHLICRPRKMGLGSAYTDAFRWILNHLPVDVVIQMDADLSHPPQFLQTMIDMIKKGVDVVVASRYSKHGGIGNWPLHRKIMSKAANHFVRLLLGIQIRDVTSGYRAFKINVIQELLTKKLHGKGYDYQVETIYLISKMNKRIEELPFIFSNRREGKSKLALKEIIRFASMVIALRLNSSVMSEEKTKTIKIAKV